MKLAMAAALDPVYPSDLPAPLRTGRRARPATTPSPGAQHARWLAAVVFAAAGCGGGSTPEVDRCAGVTCTAAGPCRLPGACDPATGTCSSPARADGLACDDANGCTLVDTCLSGTCVGGAPRACTATGPCRVAGTCDPASGECGSPPAPDGSSCDDGSLCTAGDACLAGACAGVEAVRCEAPDACHAAATCDPASGACGAPVQLDGPSCDLQGGLGVCRAGACVAAQGIEGTYGVHSLSAGTWNGWGEGTVTVSDSGTVTDFFEASSDGSFSTTPDFEAVMVDQAGRITVDGYPAFWGSLSAGRAEALATLPDGYGSASLTVYQRQATGLTAADLAGSWEVHALLVGVGTWEDAAWYRGRVEVDPAGGTARDLVDSTGQAWSEAYGSIVSPTGAVLRQLGFDAARRGGGALSASRQLLASVWTPLDDGSALELAVRLGPAPQLVDLAGDWSFHALVATGSSAYQTGAGHGAFAIDGGGVLSPVYQAWTAADLALPEGQLEVDADGSLRLTALPSFRGRLSADGELLVGTFTLDPAGAGLVVCQRRVVPPVRPVLEPGAAAAAAIGEAGGTLQAVATDGTTYRLDLPPGAVGAGETVELSMTPIADLPGLPVSGALLGAVQLEPDGLRLLLPATLTIQGLAAPPPQVIGFTYPGRGLDRVSFAPAGTPEALVVDVLHFSGAGAAAGSAAGQGGTDQAFLDQLGVIAQVQGLGAIGAFDQVMDAWLDAIIAQAPGLAQEASLDLFMTTLGRRLSNWSATQQLLGLGEGPACLDRPGRAADLKALLDVAVPRLIREVEEACKAVADRCAKLSALKMLLEYNAAVQRWADSESCLGLEVTQLCGACGPAGDALPATSGITCDDPMGACRAVTGSVGQTRQLGASFTGVCGNDVGASSDNPGGIYPSWESTRPGVASVDAVGAVSFRDVGAAAIRMRPKGLPCFRATTTVATGVLSFQYMVRVTGMAISGGGSGCALVTAPPADYLVYLTIDERGWVTLTPTTGPYEEHTLGRAGLPDGVLAFYTEAWNRYVPQGTLPAFLIEREWRLEGTAGQMLTGWYRWGWMGEYTGDGYTGCQGRNQVVLEPRL